MAERKAIPKKTRIRVYRKYGGHCAYCGRPISYKEMQADHVTPLYWHNGQNEEANYNPACRACNFYKSTMPLDKFRHNLETLLDRVRKEFIYRLAVQYGLVTERPHKIIFYCENHATADMTFEDAERIWRQNYRTQLNLKDFMGWTEEEQALYENWHRRTAPYEQTLQRIDAELNQQ